MVDTKAVSVRLPLDLLNELNSYATDKGMVRGGDANIGGAIIAVLRQHFGQSDNVKQVSDNMDIDSIVNVAVESHLEAVLNQVRDLELKVHSQETYSLLYTSLKADVDIRFDETNKAIADIKEATAPDTIPESEDDSNPEITGNSPEPDALPIIEAIANIASPPNEEPHSGNALSDVIAATAKANNITYRLNHDGSVVLRSLKGIGFRDLKRMNDQQLKEIGLFKTLIGKDEKFFPVDPDTIVATAKPKATKKQSTKVDTGKRFTSMAAAAYYRQKTGQPLKETTLIANAKKYGFVIKEKGSGLYALIDES